MAGGLTISTLNDSSGVLSVRNGMTGIPKAWVQFNGSTATVLASFNVSSITRSATGNYLINLTTSFASASYSAVASCSYNASATAQFTRVDSTSTTQINVTTIDTTGTNRDSILVSCIAIIA